MLGVEVGAVKPDEVVGGTGVAEGVLPGLFRPELSASSDSTAELRGGW